MDISSGGGGSGGPGGGFGGPGDGSGGPGGGYLAEGTGQWLGQCPVKKGPKMSENANICQICTNTSLKTSPKPTND